MIFHDFRLTWRFFQGDWRLPSRIVLLDADGALSLDALSWLSNHRVPLIQINWRGEVVHVIGDNPTAVDPVLAKAQLDARKNCASLRIARRLIVEKIENSIETLRHFLPSSRVTGSILDKLKHGADLINQKTPETFSHLMGIEARAGGVYFRALRFLHLQWKGVDRRPIPDDWNRIGRRASKVASRLYSNRNATHPFNAMLNYAYAILETQMRTHIVAAGLDPTIGFFHGSYDGKQGLVYDLMEPLRPVVDRQLLEFAQKHTFSPGDFTLTSTGVCRLNPQLARNVVRAIDVSYDASNTVNRFLSELHKARDSAHWD